MFVITGNVPSQKNSKQIFVNRATGKPFISSSKLVKSWQEQALWQLKSVPPVVAYPASVTLVFYYDSKRRHDLDNSCASVMDILVKAGIIIDDSVSYIETVTLQYGGISRDNPRVEVFIS